MKFYESHNLVNYIIFILVSKNVMFHLHAGE